MIYLRYFTSVLVWQIFNPYGLYCSLLQNIGQIISVIRSFKAGASFRSEAMSLPFSGEWKVFNGGIERKDSHSWQLTAQRYAYDFVVTGDSGRRFKTDGTAPDDYYAFGRDVLAPADGIVADVKYDLNDNRHAGSGKIDIAAKDMRGNYIIISHGNNIYSLTAHLMKNSCLVRKGDQVKRGQVIARCGNSGHSTEPHIHFQLQDHKNFYICTGLPVLFSGIKKKRDSTTHEILEQGYISRNDFVSNCDSGNSSIEVVTRHIPVTDWKPSILSGIINTAGIVVGGSYIYYSIFRAAARLLKPVFGF